MKDNPRQALFLHIPKTAGTSIVDLARGEYGNGNVCSHGEFIGKSPDTLRNIRFLSGHFGWNYATQFMDDRFSFTFLRDPVERILSSYYFCLSRDPDEFPEYRLVHENTLERYLEISLDSKQSVWNLQTRLLASGWKVAPECSDEELFHLAKAHVARFSYIGFTETFDTDFRYLLGSLGLNSSIASTRTNVTQKPRVDELPTFVNKLLNKVSELDRAVYEYAFAFSKDRRHE